MLVVRSSKELAKARITSSLVFARGAWLNVVERTGLLLDTRFAPAAKGDARDGACIYLLHRGRFAFHGDAAPRFEGPAAFALTEQHIEGARGARPWTFCAEGTPFAAVELHVADQDATTRATDMPTPIAIGEACWSAIERAIERSASGAPEAEIASAVSAMLRALADAGALSQRVADEATLPLPFERLWRSVQPLAERFAVSATLDQLGVLIGTSSRQLDRYVRDFFRAFPMVGGGFRATTVHLRVKLAVMLLSAEGVTVGDVADAVGYGSVAAMGRAFRDAGLAAPSTIREALRRSNPAQ